MPIREQDKHFLWSLYSAVSIIFVWKGLWDGIYELPYICDVGICQPFIYLFIGFAMLTLSGIIFKEFDPLGGLEKAINKVLHIVCNHPLRSQFIIQYHDQNQKKDIDIRADKVRSIEKGVLVVEDSIRKQEVFIPIHRVTQVTQNGKPYWRL